MLLIFCLLVSNMCCGRSRNRDVAVVALADGGADWKVGLEAEGTHLPSGDEQRRNPCVLAMCYSPDGAILATAGTYAQVLGPATARTYGGCALARNHAPKRPPLEPQWQGP